MKIVLDTNIILASLSPTSPYRIIFDRFEDGQFSLCLTTEILLEYEEKIAQNFNPAVAEAFMGAMLMSNQIIRTSVFFQLRLIYPDLDDNKFADCAFAAGADFLVSNDRDFRVLKRLKFPVLKILTIEEFVEVLKTGL